MRWKATCTITVPTRNLNHRVSLSLFYIFLFSPVISCSPPLSAMITCNDQTADVLRARYRTVRAAYSVLGYDMIYDMIYMKYMIHDIWYIWYNNDIYDKWYMIYDMIWYIWYDIYDINYIYIYMIYTECPRRNVPDFWRVILMLKYTDITQNTFFQSWTVSEIMASEVWNSDSCYTLIDYQIHIKTGRNMLFL